MTIRPGEQWGTMGPVPVDLVRLDDDGDVGRFVTERIRAGAPRCVPPIAPRRGDLFRSLGGDPARDRVDAGADVAHLPLDGLRVEVDGEELWAVAHVVARRSWWRGEVVAVMNGQYLGDWDVAPRAHPNDGRADLVRAQARMPLRARWQARRRLPLGTHVPHPDIVTRQASGFDLVFDRPLKVWLDGYLVGEHRRVVVSVVPDLLTVCV
jgi:hypothetical protein